MDDRNIKLINDAFRADGYSVWDVGGFVRDSLLGLTPKDRDLCTDAFPDEQIAVYRKNGFKFFETGLQHGTITVVMDHIPYEITSLRRDAETDGRHAKVVYTRDLIVDLERRDLTMNAIARTMTGEYIDPFGGQDDLRNGVVRFVNDPALRITEDYLRILRFFRFHGRFARTEIAPEIIKAFADHGHGLSKISVERIWSEYSRIITGPNAKRTLIDMERTGIAGIIGAPKIIWEVFDAAYEASSNPALVIGLASESDDLARRWKWSNNERNSYREARRWANASPALADFKEALVRGGHRDDLIDIAGFKGMDVEALKAWSIPVFPVSGDDLIKGSVKPGPEMGRMLNQMKDRWIESDYTLSASALMGQ